MRLLHVNDISKSIKGKTIYRNISMDIFEGECYGIIGPDDSGKTSVVHTMVGLMRADRGMVRWFEERMPGRVLRKEIGYVPDDLLCFENMTGAELLDMSMKLGNRDISIDDAEMLIDYFEINPGLRLDEMDEDMNKCTYIISAFLKEPKVLVLDEPFNFLGEKSSTKLKNIIKQYINAGNTVIVTAESCKDIMDMCKRFSAIKEGEQIRRDEELSWYVPAKLVAVYGIDITGKAMLTKNIRNLVLYKLDEKKSVFLYMGIEDIEKLKKLLLELKCRDFTVRDLTINNQIFKEYGLLEESEQQTEERNDC